jgi:hypothetical protein
MSQQPDDERGDLPATPLDALGLIAAKSMILVDRAVTHIVEWRPHWYERTLARAVSHRDRMLLRSLHALGEQSTLKERWRRFGE